MKTSSWLLKPDSYLTHVHKTAHSKSRLRPTPPWTPTYYIYIYIATVRTSFWFEPHRTICFRCRLSVTESSVVRHLKNRVPGGYSLIRSLISDF